MTDVLPELAQFGIFDGGAACGAPRSLARLAIWVRIVHAVAAAHRLPLSVPA
jgi:hypothetical protein